MLFWSIVLRQCIDVAILTISIGYQIRGDVISAEM